MPVAMNVPTRKSAAKKTPAVKRTPRQTPQRKTSKQSSADEWVIVKIRKTIFEEHFKQNS
jgi:hypothetical protein